MSSRDHTTIVWKNGVYMEHPYSFDENDNYVNHCPFEYGRDGNIHTIFGNKIYDHIEWYRDEYDAEYEREGADDTQGFRFPYNITDWLKWHLGFIRRVGYRREIGVFKDGNVEVYIWRKSDHGGNPTYVSFYKDPENTYIVLGGYGHHDNVYTHFMGRGYGDEFEKEMAYEAYEWILDDVLRDVADRISGDWDPEENLAMAMRKTFGDGLREDSWYKGIWSYWWNDDENKEE